MNRLAPIDPVWAWEPYEPSAEAPWDRRRAAHLFRRAGWGAASHELDDALNRSPSDVLEQLAGEAKAKPPANEESTSDNDDAAARQVDFDQFAATILATGDPKQLSAWWVYVMLQSPRQLVEKTSLFWHGHFATSADKVTDAQAMFDQNQLFRRYALGDFAALTHAIARDPAMLIYLDSATNRKAHPNENFARELMELFCLGEGNYTERDIQELARCFTGWEVRQSNFRFNRFQHDTGEKSILGLTGEFPDAEAVDVVLDQPAAPRFIVGKLIRFFVFDEPSPDPSLVEPLANELREHDWDIGRVVRRILTSRLFFSEHALARKIRSPVELVVGLLRSLDGTANAHQLAADLVTLGQGLFYPPNVKGWDGGRTWINSSTLLDRANVVGRVLRDDKTRFGGGTLAEYFASGGLNSPGDVLDRIVELTLAVPLADAARRRLVELHNGASGDPSRKLADMLHALAALPEFHLA